MFHTFLKKLNFTRVSMKMQITVQMQICIVVVEPWPRHFFKLKSKQFLTIIILRTCIEKRRGEKRAEIFIINKNALRSCERYSRALYVELNVIHIHISLTMIFYFSLSLPLTHSRRALSFFSFLTCSHIFIWNVFFFFIFFASTYSKSKAIDVLFY